LSKGWLTREAALDGFAHGARLVEGRNAEREAVLFQEDITRITSNGADKGGLHSQAPSSELVYRLVPEKSGIEAPERQDECLRTDTMSDAHAR
jgi:hypothetical protein